MVFSLPLLNGRKNSNSLYYWILKRCHQGLFKSLGLYENELLYKGFQPIVPSLYKACAPPFATWKIANHTIYCIHAWINLRKYIPVQTKNKTKEWTYVWSFHYWKNVDRSDHIIKRKSWLKYFLLFGDV